MHVVSGAGEFEISVEQLAVRDGCLLMTGQMGIWNAEITLQPVELRRMLGLSLRSPRVLRWLVAATVRPRSAQST
jgi:hypothetical protein